MEDTRGSGELQKYVDVDGRTYKVHMLSPSKAFKISAKLFKLIGEPMAALAASSDKKNEEKATQAIPMAVKALCHNLDEEAVLILIKELIATTSYDNKSINFEDHFQGKLGLLMKLLVKIIEVQFGDFIEGMGALFGKAPKMELVSPSLSTSAGP
jgi:hypothetical protein